MKVLLILLALIALLLMLPVGVDAGYTGGQASVGIRIGPKVIWLYPGRFGKAEHKKKKKEKPAEEAQTVEKKPRSLNVDWDEIKAAGALFIRSVKRLRFRVRRLRLHFISGSPDPYNAAMLYGYVSAGVNALGLGRLKHGDVQLGVDFAADAPVIDGYLSITIRVYYLCKFGLTMAFGGLRLLLAHRKRIKQEQKANALIAGKEV